MGTAKSTLVDLLELQEAVDSSWADLRDAGINVLQSAIRTDLNSVVVGVQGLDSTGVTELRKRFGQDLVVEDAKPSTADACVNTFNCRPIKGGISLEINAVAKCTSGFVVKRVDTGQLHVLTAGHCIVGNGGYDAVWQHNADSFGRARHNTWLKNATRGGDVGLITIFTAETPTTKNQMHRGNGDVRTVSGWDSVQVVGDQSCRYGLTSKLTCGIINAVNVTRPSPLPNGDTMTVTHTNQVNFDSLGGDSGGPFFYYASGGSGYVIAQGTHVHSGQPAESVSWFTPISWGRTTFSSLIGYDYSVCVTSSCS